MRKKDDTLRDTLLASARHIADTKGIDLVSIRSIAQKAGVATGTVYNYFSNKNEILLALTEDYWKQTLLDLNAAVTADSFCGQLEEIFHFLKEQIDCSAGKLMNSLEKIETAGRERMASMQNFLEKTLIQLMEQDKNIKQEVWDASFTKETYARFLMRNILMLLKTNTPDTQPDIQFLIAIVKRTIYLGNCEIQNAIDVDNT